MTTRLELANAIRALSMDAVQAANSGHPGMPLGMADIAEVLWNDYLKHNPANPAWPDRDRFVLSNGHGSMLLYSLLHLTGYDFPVQELIEFRQLGSQTPGHPEVGETPGVETTTGPLGQGLANAVGMALVEKMLAARFNRPDFDIVDHYTYVFAGDGCLMEGISHEACSLAGTLKLGKLMVLYDDNGISIDGEVNGWFTDDTPARFGAYGWHVVPDVDGHDPQSVARAIDSARAVTDRPSLICCRTVIGRGSPNKQGTAGVHGAPLGPDEVEQTRKALGWTSQPFEIPRDLRDVWNCREQGEARQADWEDKLVAYRVAHPELAAEFDRRLAGDLPADWAERSDAAIAAIGSQAAAMATRKASLGALKAYGPLLPELVGGSADLTGSNLTQWSDTGTVTADNPDGNYLHFGVREFGMTAMANGMALHGGVIPYTGTFLTFSDYARNALRMAALMKVQNISVYSHDSIGLGEDGPTHQAVEHLSSLRIMPGMRVWRPCDTVETVVAWRDAIERSDGPTCLALSRQGVAFQARTEEQVGQIRRGGYALVEPDTAPQAIIIATGSEVEMAVAAAASLGESGLAVRVVSMPCTSLFDAQPDDYREQVLPAAVTARVAVEAGVTEFWHRYVGPAGRIIGIDRYGASAPARELYATFGLTTERVASTVREIV